MPNLTAWPSATLAIALAHDTTHTGLEGHAPCAYGPVLAAEDHHHTQRDHPRSLMGVALVILMLKLVLLCLLFVAKRPMWLQASVHEPPYDVVCDPITSQRTSIHTTTTTTTTNGLHTPPHDVQLDDA
jgi:hypothetical protein